MKSSVSGNDKKVRLQVFLSHSGVCSRRKAMEFVQAGRVKVNGTVNKEPSTPVDGDRDLIEVDGRAIKEKSFTYLIVNKPAGYVTTKSDRHAAKIVIDLVPSLYKHLVPAGRLDQNTEGLVLLTNDGDVVFKLTHPSHEVDKVYLVRIAGELDEARKKRLEDGIVIDGRKTAPAKITDLKISGGQSEFLMTIHEGRKRQIRLMVIKSGSKVIYLKRLQQGPLCLGDLKTGQWRLLSENEIKELKKL